MGQSVEEQIGNKTESISKFPEFQFHYGDNLCFRAKINALYSQIIGNKSRNVGTSIKGAFGFPTSPDDINPRRFYIFAAQQVYKESLACWLADKARDIRDAMDKL